MKTSQHAPLSPLWAGAIAAIASLYGLWPGMAIYRGAEQHGETLFLLMFVGPITFFLVMAPAAGMLGFIFRRIEQTSRCIALLALGGLFPLIAGVPELFGLAVVAVFTYLAWSNARKEQSIARERDAFKVEGKPREVEIGPGYLAAFPDPLWNRLDLDDCKPLWAIEGMQDGAPYMIVEVSHAAFGLLANEHSQAKTTFVLAAIPASITGRLVSWRPPGYHTWADSKYVYLAMPGKQIKPSSWRQTIANAFYTVGALQPGGASVGQRNAEKRPYRAVGGGFAVQAFRCAKMLLLALALLWGGLAPIFGWVEFSAESVKMVPAFFLGSLFCFGGAWYFAARARICWLRG